MSPSSHLRVIPTLYRAKTEEKEKVSSPQKKERYNAFAFGSQRFFILILILLIVFAIICFFHGIIITNTFKDITPKDRKDELILIAANNAFWQDITSSLFFVTIGVLIYYAIKF